MSAFLDLVRKRQSARSYRPQPIARDSIEQCLIAAQAAPSACNSQPWHFIVVDDPELKNKLASKIFSGPYAVNGFAKSAPALIVVVSEKEKFLSKIGGYLRGVSYYLIDIGIAIEHFILQAEELNLRTCWIGWFDEKAAKNILSVPHGKKIDCIVSLGYSDEPPRPKKRKTLDEISSYNRYTHAIKEGGTL